MLCALVAQFRSAGLSLALSLPLAGFFPFSFSFFSFLERSPAPGVWNQLDKLLSYGAGKGRGRASGAGRGGEGRALRGGVGSGVEGLPPAGARVPPLGDCPQLWANVGEGLTVATGKGREAAVGGSGWVRRRTRRASGLAERELGFRAAVNEARGGRRGLHGFGGRGLPRPARHSFPLNRAPGPAPPPRPARIDLGWRPSSGRGTAPEVARGAARGWGRRHRGNEAWGGPLCPPALFPRSSLNSQLLWREGMLCPFSERGP